MLMADAVFEGGGVKGIGLIGAVVEAESRGYKWCNLAGTSAGAIVAGLLAAGHSGTDVAEILETLDYRRFRDPGPWARIPGIGRGLALLLENGIYRGDFFEAWIDDLLAAKGVRTFGDLVMPEYAEEPRYRYRLRVVAADLTARRLVVFPQDAIRYGIQPDELGVARAIRMSMSIPFFYRPVHLGGAPGRRRRSLLVDGGVLSNFPVWLFDSDGPPEWPTFGFKLVSPGSGSPAPIGGPVSMLGALFATMMEAHDARHVAERDFVRTIPIPTLGVGTVDFNITRGMSRRLFSAGRRAAARFLDRWDFPEYVAAFRSPG